MVLDADVTFWNVNLPRTRQVSQRLQGVQQLTRRTDRRQDQHADRERVLSEGPVRVGGSPQGALPQLLPSLVARMPPG